MRERGMTMRERGMTMRELGITLFYLCVLSVLCGSEIF
jgi:hypothetical protein